MKYAYMKQIGTNRILGTDHPIKIVVYRGARHEWIVAIICNGIAETSREFPTRKAAIEAADSSANPMAESH